MINKTYLFEKLLSYCDNVQGVDEQVLDAHLQKHGLTIRADHRSFLLKYGNSNSLLKFGFADYTYALFEQYTSDSEEYFSGIDELPKGTNFIGHDITDDILCINNQSGKIYGYEDQELSDCYYVNIDALLFLCLIQCLRNQKMLPVSELVIVEKDEKEQFFQQQAAYHLVGLDNFFTKYFLKENQLIYCRKSSNGAYAVEYLQGEVLNSIAHEGLLFKN